MGWAKDGSGLDVKRIRGMTMPQWFTYTDDPCARLPRNTKHTTAPAERSRRSLRVKRQSRKDTHHGLAS